jgi:hypothetical protein
MLQLLSHAITGAAIELAACAHTSPSSPSATVTSAADTRAIFQYRSRLLERAASCEGLNP